MMTSTSMPTWRIVTLRTEKDTTISTTTWMKTTALEVYSAKHLKYKPVFIVEAHTLISKAKHLFGILCTFYLITSPKNITVYLFFL